MAEWTISELRSKISDAFDSAVRRHEPVFVRRGSRELGALFGLEEVERLVAAYDFEPEVLFEDARVSIWLPEFALYGHGDSFETARDDLLDEVRDYVADYLESSEQYLHSPNRAGHFPHVIKAALADLRGALEETLFAQPQRETSPPERSAV